MEREERERRKKNIVFKGVKEEKGDGLCEGGRRSYARERKKRKEKGE